MGLVKLVGFLLGFHIGLLADAHLLHLVILLDFLDSDGILPQFLFDNGTAPARQFLDMCIVETAEDSLHVGHDALDFPVLFLSEIICIHEQRLFPVLHLLHLFKSGHNDIHHPHLHFSLRLQIGNHGSAAC